MTESTEERPQTKGEELFNAISHGLAVLAAAVATPLLITGAIRAGAAGVVGASVFAATVVILYTTSAVYHAVPPKNLRTKRLLQLLDHSAIYLLIAGSYTPFLLTVVTGALAWTVFGLVWGLAIAGIFTKATGVLKCPKLSTALYVAMGWLAVLVIKPLWMGLGAWGFFWLVAGGVLYTAGVAFFLADGKWKFAHFVWHLFVVGGTACHFLAVNACAG